MDSVKDIKERFKDKIIEWYEHSPQRIYVTVDRKDLVEVARYLFFEAKARFAIASGVDTRQGVEILYHFSLDKEGGKIVSLKVLLPREDLKVESLAPHIKATNWIEREMAELLGVEFLHHPDMRRLLLPEDWPEDKYPLRRDYRG